MVHPSIFIRSSGCHCVQFSRNNIHQFVGNAILIFLGLYITVLIPWHYFTFKIPEACENRYLCEKIELVPKGRELQQVVKCSSKFTSLCNRLPDNQKFVTMGFDLTSQEYKDIWAKVDHAPIKSKN